MSTTDRGVEDRLLVMETKLGYLATRQELTEQIANLRDAMRVWFFQGQSAVVILIVVSTFVNHVWK